MSRSVLFTCANANQSANAVPVAEYLLERGIACHFMVLDPVYQQAAGPAIAQSSVAKRVTCFAAPSLGLPTPFSMLSMRARLTAVRARRDDIIGAAGAHDGVVVGMDGAFERLVLKRYRDTNRFTAILWDGLVTRQPRLFQAPTRPDPLTELAWRVQRWSHFAGRRTLLRAASRIGGEAYVPGLGGHTPVDTIYTMGRFVTDAFRSQGLTTAIETTGIPRFAGLARAEPPPPRDRIALYLTGSFLWHDEVALDQCQQRDLDALAAALPHSGWHLRIRIHPREDVSRYARFRGQSGVTLSVSSESPAWDDLSRARATITAMSTAGLEGLALGRPLIVYLGAFPGTLRDITLGIHPGIPFARSLDQLTAALARAASVEDTAALRAVLDDFVDPGTSESARRIADSIARRLA